MRASTIATLAVALVATAEASRPQPYMVARAPFASLLGIARRNTGGYSPETELCGDGDTCSEACGSGYETCISADKNNHCFNPAAGDSCCSIQSGGKSSAHRTRLSLGPGADLNVTRIL